MEDAFESDNEDDVESTPLNNHRRARSEPRVPRDETSALPGAYDFEREYDFPPPGSPPRPSARALPNDYGNSNGLLPTSPIHVSRPRPSLFRRAVGAILPTHYQQVPSQAPPTRVTGGGVENDGVFANVMAKPQPARVVRTEDGDVHLVPEESQKETPPSYVEAQADAVPPYWETTVHAPAGLEPGADMIIDDLPTGSFLVFCLNLFISVFFQFVGFFLTYLLHTSHAAKYGSRAGLGLTLIQYGFYSRSANDGDNVPPEGSQAWVGGSMANATDPGTFPNQEGGSLFSSTSRDWLSFLFMTMGWFLLLSSIVGFWRVKRWEHSVRVANVPTTPEDVERDLAIRRNMENVFGLSLGDAPGAQTPHSAQSVSQQVLQEARLTRDLRAAGLL